MVGLTRALRSRTMTAGSAYSKPHSGGNVARIASTTSATVHMNTGPGVTSRDLQRACNTPHASSQTIVANVVRPVTPPAGPYNDGAANSPASLSSTKAPIANEPIAAPRTAAIAAPFVSASAGDCERDTVAIVVSREFSPTAPPCSQIHRAATRT